MPTKRKISGLTKGQDLQRLLCRFDAQRAIPGCSPTDITKSNQIWAKRPTKRKISGLTKGQDLQRLLCRFDAQQAVPGCSPMDITKSNQIWAKRE